MSRIGKAPINLPDKVKVEFSGLDVKVVGPKGTLEKTMHPSMKIKMDKNVITVERPGDSKYHKALHGLTRQLIANMIEGVTKGYQRELEIQGVGYRAEQVGKSLKILVGYSHPILVRPVPGITLALDDPTHIRVSGIDKELVGMTAAKIRGFRPPEPYKGKGIRYKNEVVRKKAGKTAA